VDCQISPSLIDKAYTTACTTVQAVMNDAMRHLLELRPIGKVRFLCGIPDFGEFKFLYFLLSLSKIFYISRGCCKQSDFEMQDHVIHHQYEVT